MQDIGFKPIPSSKFQLSAFKLLPSNSSDQTNCQSCENDELNTVKSMIRANMQPGNSNFFIVIKIIVRAQITS